MGLLKNYFKSGFGIITLILYAIILLYPFLITGFRNFASGDFRILIVISIATIIFTSYGFFKISDRNHKELNMMQMIGVISLLLVLTIIWMTLAFIILIYVNPL